MNSLPHENSKFTYSKVVTTEHLITFYAFCFCLLLITRVDGHFGISEEVGNVFFHLWLFFGMHLLFYIYIFISDRARNNGFKLKEGKKVGVYQMLERNS